MCYAVCCELRHVVHNDLLKFDVKEQNVKENPGTVSETLALMPVPRMPTVY